MSQSTPTPARSAYDWLDTRKFARFHKRLAVLGSLACIFAGYNSQIVAYIIPLALKEWQLTPVEAGAMMSYGFVGLMIGAAGFGIVSDRLGRKNSLMLVMIVLSVFSGATYFAPNFQIFCVLRFFAGLGIGGVVPLIATLVAEYSPSVMRAKLLTLVTGTFTLGWAAAGLAAMVLVPGFGWRMPLLLGVLPLFLLPAIHAYLPESVRFLAGKSRYPEAVREMQRIENLGDTGSGTWTEESFPRPDIQVSAGVRDLFRPGLTLMTVLIWGTYVCCWLCLYGLSTWLPSLLTNAGFSLVKSYSFGIVQALGAFVGAFLLGCFMDAVGRKLGLAACFFIGGLSVLLFGFVTSTFSLYIAGAATGLFLAGMPAGLHVVAGETYPTGIRATGTGWAYSVGRIGSILGPVFGGVVQMAGFTFTQFFVLFSLPAFVCVMLVALYPIGVKREGLEKVTEKLLHRS